jgi:hypothetical protein
MIERIQEALNDAVALMLLAIPNIVSFLVILIIGWIIASLLAGAVAALLRVIKFNDMAARAGISDFVQRMGVRTDPAGVLSGIVKWFIRLLTLIVAFDALGLPAVSAIIRDILAWLPNLVVALVIIVVAGLIANALASVVRGASSKAGLDNPDLLASIARVAVLGFGIIAALSQVGIAATLVNTLFMGLVGALALALGLAFGLGGRETAGEIVRSWYRQSREAAPRVERTVIAPQEDRSTGPRSDKSDTQK